MMQAIQTFDTSVLLYIQDFLRTPFWNTFFVIFSRLGDGGILWIALGLALLFPAKTRRRGFDVLICLALASSALFLAVAPAPAAASCGPRGADRVAVSGPVEIRVTQRGFGRDWRYPITSRYQDEF